MKKTVFFSAIFLFQLSFSISAQVSDSMKLYVNEALDVMQKNSLYSSKVNWKSVRDSVNTVLPVLKANLEAEALVIGVYKKLEDNHGMYGGIDTSYRYVAPGPERTMSKSILAQYQKPRAVKISMLPNGIAYYKMPAVLIGSDRVKMKEWSNLMMDSLCKMNAQNPRGYIIDLRMNNGGNIEPMWETLKYMIGEDNKTYSVDAARNIVEEAVDTALLAYHNAAVPDRKCPFNETIASLPVAVLIGPGTASAGEIMALSFTTRKNTRLFGEPSIGVASVTNGFIIQGKGYLLLTVAYLADARKKVLYKKMIEPDVVVKADNDNYVQPALDETVQAALKWLDGKME